MNKVAQIIGGISVVVAGGLAPVAPQEMTYLYSYQVPVADVQADLEAYKNPKQITSSTTKERIVKEEPVVFQDTDDNGLISIAVFASSKKREPVYIQIPDAQYTDMGLNAETTGKGKWSNPRKEEYLSVFELLIAKKASAAIAYNSASSAQTAVNATSLTFSHTTSGSDRFLALSATAQDCDRSRTLSATYNGSSMTQYDTEVYIPVICPNSKLYAFYLVAPSTGTNNIVISTTGSATRLGGAASSYTGVAQTGTIDAGAKKVQAGATSITNSHTVVASNTWGIVWALAYNGNCVNLGVSNSLSSVRDCEDDMVSIADSNGTLSTGSNTFGMTQTNASLTTMINASIVPVADVAVPVQLIIFD